MYLTLVMDETPFNQLIPKGANAGVYDVMRMQCSVVVAIIHLRDN